ncbi:MAG: polysaccharide biosynthesis C-terminal domain-containing protein, partial [Halobacteriota archaeon]
VLMGMSFFGAGTNVVLNYILIPIYGVNGAAVATGTSLAAMNVFHLVVVYRIAGLQPFRRTYLKPLTASVLAVGVVYTVTRYVLGVSLISLIGMFVVFMVLYFFLLLAMKSFEREDLMVMRAIDKKLNVNTHWIRKIIMKFL